MQSPRLSYAYSMSMSQLKVVRFSLEFGCCSISPLNIPLEGFSLNFGQMLISMRPCAELMNQLCKNKVKDKINGHGV